MTGVSDTVNNQGALSVSVALCVEGEAMERFRGVLRHLLVGLVDQAVQLKVLSCDPRIEALTLGPIQTLVHERIVWPLVRRRTEALLDALSQQPPTVVHAMSSASYRAAEAIADSFDADLVLQVTSLADCDAIAESGGKRVGRFLAPSDPLRTVLVDQLHIQSDRVEVIRPGVLASQQVACFTEPDRVPTIVCISALERDNGVDRLIEAVDILHHRGHEVMLFLLGQGRQESVLRRLIRDRQLSSFVTLAQPFGDPGRAMSSGDIFARPNVGTSFRADSLQAMSAGMAVVTAPSTVYDHLHDGETAVVCDPPTAESLATGIERLLADRSLAQCIAANAREYVRTHHAMSSMAERTADTYRKLALARATFPITEQRA